MRASPCDDKFTPTVEYRKDGNISHNNGYSLTTCYKMAVVPLHNVLKGETILISCRLIVALYEYSTKMWMCRKCAANKINRLNEATTIIRFHTVALRYRVHGTDKTVTMRPQNTCQPQIQTRLCLRIQLVYAQSRELFCNVHHWQHFHA